MRKAGFSLFVAFLLVLSFLAVPAVAPPVVSAQGIADLPNPLTVSFTASGSEGDPYSFTVVPNATLGSVINQYSRDWMIINRTSHNNTAARFFNMSTASGTLSGDLSGSIDFQWNKLDFATPYFNSSDWFIADPDGVGILYLTGNITGTVLGDLTFVGAADFDYKGTSVKGEGRVMTVEDWEEGLTTPPSRVLIGEVSYEISGGTITGTFTLRNYSDDPVGLEGKVDTGDWLHLSGQLLNDESDWITNETVRFMQFTRGPVDPSHRIVLEEMAPGREVNQTITAGDVGVGGTISLLRTGVLDVIEVSGQDIPVYSITGTRTVENNWGSNMSATMGGVAKTIVLVDMVDFDINTGVTQHSFTMMPGYSEGYLGTGHYAGFEAYVVPDTHISLTLFLDGDDYRYSLLPTPQITSVSPNVGQAGTFDVTINGKFFWVNETFHPLTIDFGAGITVNSHQVVSDTEITASITIATDIGPRNVSVTKRGQTGTLVDGFGVGAALDANVTFVGRAKASQWIEPFVVHFINATTETNVTATTNGTGWFTVTGIQPDTYDVGIKNVSCLSEVVTGQSFVMNQSTVIDFGTPREGDVDGNDLINMLDKGPLADAWNTWPGQPLWNPSCDFNRDGIINMLDKGPIGNNWGQWGELLD